MSCSILVSSVFSVSIGDGGKTVTVTTITKTTNSKNENNYNNTNSNSSLMTTNVHYITSHEKSGWMTLYIRLRPDTVKIQSEIQRKVHL